jgi:pimeloyl-ACP methyl ester carboxylesterase
MYLGVAIVLGLTAAMALLAWARPLAVLAWSERWALRRAGLRSAELSSSAASLHYFRGGSGPTLVLLHGAGDQAGAWSRIVPALQSKYELVIPDLPGHGESEPRTGPLGIGAMLSGVEALLDSVVPRAPLILVGNSLGAWIATLYAHRHPERISRIVLVNGGALMGDRPDISLMPKDRAAARRALEATRCPGSRPVPDYVVDDIIRQARRGPIGRIAAGAADMFQYLLQGRLQEIGTPVDLLWGECDQLMPLSYARKMLAAFPAARLTTLPTGGHVPQRECAKDFAAKLMDLLQKPEPQAKVK